MKRIVAIGVNIVNGFGWFYQYYAKGDSWRLPEGAYETMALLKDAGGPIFFTQIFCFVILLASSYYFNIASSDMQLSWLLYLISTPA